ncbi:MAG: hypothetical protein ABI705_09205, partial [Aestuariivirga sp.]
MTRSLIKTALIVFMFGYGAARADDPNKLAQVVDPCSFGCPKDGCNCPTKPIEIKPVPPPSGGS